MNNVIICLVLLFPLNMHSQDITDDRVIHFKSIGVYLNPYRDSMIISYPKSHLEQLIEYREEYQDKCYADSFQVKPSGGEIWIGPDGFEINSEWRHQYPTFRGFTKFLKSKLKK